MIKINNESPNNIYCNDSECNKVVLLHNGQEITVWEKTTDSSLYGSAIFGESVFGKEI